MNRIGKTVRSLTSSPSIRSCCRLRGTKHLACRLNRAPFAARFSALLTGRPGPFLLKTED
jgi:hypothetical protein